MGSISMPTGRGSQLHNMREYENFGLQIPDNIDINRTKENIVFVHKPIKEAYEDIFGEAVAEYNAKQKRADRKIYDYMEHIKKSKNGEKIFYEDVIQWGKKDDFQSSETRNKAIEALTEYIDGWQSRNPNLRLVGAYMHLDEASPHLHIDYIPIAHGFKNGLKTRNSFDRALKEMGFKVPGTENKFNNAAMIWKRQERDIFGDICRSKGLVVDKEQKARGSDSVAEYKDKQRKKEKLEADISSLEAQICVKEKEHAIIEQEVIKARKRDYRVLKLTSRKNNGDTISVNKSAFNDITSDLNELEQMAIDSQFSNAEALNLKKSTEEYCQRLKAEANMNLAKSKAEKEKAKKESDALKAKAQGILDNAIEHAKKLAIQLIRDFFTRKGKSTDREERLEDFCANIQLRDGRSALEAFEDSERELESEFRYAYDDDLEI